MINQELLDYIKTQRTAGVQDSEIRANLLIGGEWDRTDINEAFLAINAPVAIRSHKKGLIFYAFLAIFIIGLGAVYLWLF